VPGHERPRRDQPDVAAAYVAHSPVVALVGGIALDHYQKDVFQEFDLLNMFRPVTQLARCRQGGAGRGRPAIIEIPIDPDEFPTPAAAVRRPD
jgi:thiamine pyrophosphate-dependent acetolactate synthase large subunit-like protein